MGLSVLKVMRVRTGGCEKITSEEKTKNRGKSKKLELALLKYERLNTIRRHEDTEARLYTVHLVTHLYKHRRSQ